MKRLFLVLSAATLVACNLDVAQPPDNPSDPATETFAAALNINIATMQKTTAGTYYKDVTVGTGTTLTKPQIVIMSYAGLLKDGSLFAQGVSQQVSVSS